MKNDLHLVCPHCQSINRVPTAKLSEHPNCGRCQQPLFTGEPIELTTATFSRHVERSDLPLLVDFWAPWCSYCRKIGPAYEKIGEEYADSLAVGKINIDEEPRLAGAEGIEDIPTLVLYRNGKAVDSITAPGSKAEIDRFIQEALAK